MHKKNLNQVIGKNKNMILIIGKFKEIYINL